MRTIFDSKKTAEELTNKQAENLQNQINGLRTAIENTNEELDLQEQELENYKTDNERSFSSSNITGNVINADVKIETPLVETDNIDATQIEANDITVGGLTANNITANEKITANEIEANEIEVNNDLTIHGDLNVEGSYIVETESIADATITDLTVDNKATITEIEAEGLIVNNEAIITEVETEGLTVNNKATIAEADITELKTETEETDKLTVNGTVYSNVEIYKNQSKRLVNTTPVWIEVPVVNTGSFKMVVYGIDDTTYYFGINISYAGNNNATIQYDEVGWLDPPTYLGNEIWLKDGKLYFHCMKESSSIQWKYESERAQIDEVVPQTYGYLPIEVEQAEHFLLKNKTGTIFTRYVQIGEDGETGVLTLSPTSWLASSDQPVQYDTIEDVDFGFYAPNQDLDKGSNPEFHTIKLDTDGKTVARLNKDGILFSQDPATVIDSGVESGTLVPEEKLVEADDLYRYNGNSYAVTYDEVSGSFYKVDTDGTLPYIATNDTDPGTAKGDYCVLENDQSIPTWNPSLGNNLELQNTGYNSIFYGLERVDLYTPSDYGTLKETKQYTFGTLVASGSKVPIKITGPEMYYNGGTNPKFYNIFWDSGYGGTGYRKFATASGYGTKDFNPDPSIINQTENVNDVLTYIQNFGTQVNLYNTLNAYIISDGYNNKYYLTGTLITSAGTHSIPVVNGGQGWDTFAEAVEAFRTGGYTLNLSNKSFTFSSVAYWAMVETNEDLYYTNHSYSYNSFIPTKPSDFYYFVGNITEYIYEHSEIINKPNGYFIKTYPNKTNDMELLNPDTTLKRFLNYNNNNYIVTYTDFGGGPYRYTFKDMNLGTGSCITGITGLDTVTIQYKSDGTIDWTRNIPDGFVVPATKSKMDEYIQTSNTYAKVGEKKINYSLTDHPITNLGDGTIVHGSAMVRLNTTLGGDEGELDEHNLPIHTNTEVKGDLTAKKDVTVGTTASDSFTAKSIAYFENGYEVGSVQEPRHAHHYGDIYRYNFDTNTDEEINSTYQRVDEKGVANGYAELDSTGRVPRDQMAYEVMNYMGSWDASAGTWPTLPAGEIMTPGDTWKVSVAGTIDGIYCGVGYEIICSDPTANPPTFDVYENNKVILGNTDLGVVGCMWLS